MAVRNDGIGRGFELGIPWPDGLCRRWHDGGSRMVHEISRKGMVGTTQPRRRKKCKRPTWQMLWIHHILNNTHAHSLRIHTYIPHSSCHCLHCIGVTLCFVL